MVEIFSVYEGNLRCRVRHGPSGQEFVTDAPVDNHGKGSAISPTDLVAAALGSCILTVMGIVAERHGIELAGATATVAKEMVNEPSRRIGKLDAVVTFPRAYSEAQRELLERVAGACPVHHSLDAHAKVSIRFTYPQ